MHRNPRAMVSKSDEVYPDNISEVINFHNKANALAVMMVIVKKYLIHPRLLSLSKLRQPKTQKFLKNIFVQKLQLPKSTQLFPVPQPSYLSFHRALTFASIKKRDEGYDDGEHKSRF